MEQHSGAAHAGGLDWEMGGWGGGGLTEGLFQALLMQAYMQSVLCTGSGPKGRMCLHAWVHLHGCCAQDMQGPLGPFRPRDVQRPFRLLLLIVHRAVSACNRFGVLRSFRSCNNDWAVSVPFRWNGSICSRWGRSGQAS